MKSTTKYFILGLFSGGVLVVALQIGAATWFYLSMVRPLQDGLYSGLRVPDLPSEEGFTFDELDLTTLAGDAYDADQLDGKVVVLNVWATWCAPCVAELPNLIALKEKLADREDVTVLCASDIDREEQIEFIEKGEYSPDIFVHSPVVMARYGDRGIPATYVFDKTGQIAFQDVGAAKWDDDKVVEYLIRLAGSGSL